VRQLGQTDADVSSIPDTYTRCLEADVSDLPRQPDQPSSDDWHPPTDLEKNWAMIAHMGSFAAAWVALGSLAPFFVLLTKGKESAFVRRHAVESLNFQINALLWVAISVFLFVIVIGVFMLAIYGLFYLVAVILGSVAASRGHRFRYPLTFRFVK
jgi:uncharacterized Tic20 family protein